MNVRNDISSFTSNGLIPDLEAYLDEGGGNRNELAAGHKEARGLRDFIDQTDGVDSPASEPPATTLRGLTNFFTSTRASATNIADIVASLSASAGACIPGAQLYVNGADDVAGPIDESDIKQNDLGDCYFMSAVAALAKQDPAAIARMIHDNGNGTYTVTLWDKESKFFGLSSQDRRREITVDASFLPNHHAAPGDNNVEIWPLILEKAYAQLRGGYGDIGAGGNPASAMFALTGNDAHVYSPMEFTARAPGPRAWPGAGSVTFESLKAELDAHKMITISSKSGDDGQVIGFGIHCNHAYTIDRLYTDESGRKMVHLRNPWGYADADVPWDQLASVTRQIQVGG